MVVFESTTSCPEREQPLEGELLGELPSAGGEEKVEVWLRPRLDGAPQVELIQYSWGSGVGWYVQKTMALDGAQAEALKTLLSPLAASLEPRPPAPPHPARPRPLRQRPPAEREGNVVRLLFS